MPVFVDPFSQPPPLLTSQIYSNSSQYTRQAPAIIERADSDTPGTDPLAKVGHMLQTQGSHRLEKYLNLKGFLEKSLKIKSARKNKNLKITQRL